MRRSHHNEEDEIDVIFLCVCYYVCPWYWFCEPFNLYDGEMKRRKRGGGEGGGGGGGEGIVTRMMML